MQTGGSSASCRPAGSRDPAPAAPAPTACAWFAAGLWPSLCASKHTSECRRQAASSNVYVQQFRVLCCLSAPDLLPALY